MRRGGERPRGGREGIGEEDRRSEVGDAKE